ncbi:MAG: peptidylprolyl isomerase [Polyangiaceae bacterium]|jgi:peptidyl-prolyl cis-trans isomerase A (cyclophilin A)
MHRNRSRSHRLFATPVVGLLAIACNTAPTEPPPSAVTTPPPAAAAAKSASAVTTTSASSASGSVAASPPASPSASGTVVQHGGADPLAGKFTLADATAGLKGTGPLTATIDTSNGPLTCKLYDDKAPNTVANFVGLARGTRPWKSPQGDWVKRPAYDGTTFHRIIKGFMIQGGDPVGNGTGEPGYVIKDEIWPGAKHDRAGLLCMANRGHDTNGQQFFITDAAAAHLDGNYTIFGECSPEQTVHDIASVSVMGEKPATPVAIKDVVIARGK